MVPYVELYDFRRVHFLKVAPRFAAPKLEGDPKIESQIFIFLDHLPI